MFDVQTAATSAWSVEWCLRLFGALIAIRCATWRFHAHAKMPAELTEPVWFLMPFSPVPVWVMVTAQVVGVVGGVAVAARWKMVPSFRIALGAFVVLGGIRTGVGKILHNDVMFIVTALPFAWSSAKTSIRETNGWQLRAAQMTAAVVYFLTGIQKVRHSGPSWIFSDNMRWIMESASRRDGALWPAFGHTIASHTVLWFISGAALIGMELVFPLALKQGWWRRCLVVGAIGLHAMAFLGIGLDYGNWVAADLILFVNWPWLRERIVGAPPLS